MNELSRVRKTRPTTQAAEGVPRLRWTLAEFERLTELGIFTADDRIELIGGELVPISPKGNRHELLRDELADVLTHQLSPSHRLSTEIGWRPNADTYLEPDILIYARPLKGVRVPGSQVLLAVEVADSSLKYDMTAKALTYAALGVREYWVVNTQTLVTRVHRQPSAQGFGHLVDIASSESLVPLFVPLIAVRLADLDLS